MDITVIGIDIAKSVFHVVGMDKAGREQLRKRARRTELMEVVIQLPRVLLAMEACAGAHYWARKFRELGFTVRLIPPQYVRAYVKTNKNDFVDAAAICEAAQREHMRFVPVKSIEQQEIQHLHRVRELALRNQVALSNELRGVLMEYGIVLRRGKSPLREVPSLLEKHEGAISTLGAQLIHELLSEYWRLEERCAEYERRMKELCRAHPVCRRLATIPGVKHTIATAVIGTTADPHAFRNGRQFAAWLGIVPRQHSTGGTPRLLGISKRGDKYLRKLLIHGARSLLRCSARKTDPMSRWIEQLKQRKDWNKAAVAVANKNARIIWRIMTSDACFQAELGAAA